MVMRSESSRQGMACKGRQGATNLDAVGRVERGEHLRALRRLLDGLRAEDAHGGEAERPPRRRREEGELVGVGVQRAGRNTSTDWALLLR